MSPWQICRWSQPHCLCASLHWPKIHSLLDTTGFPTGRGRVWHHWSRQSSCCYTTQGRRSFGPSFSQRQKIKHLILSGICSCSLSSTGFWENFYQSRLYSHGSKPSLKHPLEKVSYRAVNKNCPICLNSAALLRVYQVVLEPFELSQPQPPVLIPKMKNSADTWVHNW